MVGWMVSDNSTDKYEVEGSGVTADYLSIGSIIIDDIILPDGKEKIGIFGGGLTHAAMGMRVWSDRIGLVSSVGGDFDQALMTLLQIYFDLTGLQIRTGVLTPRAWQVFDADGTRHETFQTDFEEMKTCIPKPDQLPDMYTEISGVHLQCPPEEVDLWVPALRQRGCQVILWEPWDMFCVPENRARFMRNCQQVDIVSPNLREARMLTGLDDPQEVILELKNYGAQTVALRMAEAGSLVLDVFGDLYPIPAYPAENILDVTGAGNAYCGGFVYGFARTGNVQQAGWYGGVSASLALHQFGALYSLDNLSERALSRLDWYRSQA